MTFIQIGHHTESCKSDYTIPIPASYSSINWGGIYQQ